VFVNIVVSGYKQGGVELIIATLEMPDNVTQAGAAAIANSQPNVASALARVIFIGLGFGTIIGGRVALRYITGLPS